MTDIPNDVYTREEAFGLCRRVMSIATARDVEVYVWSELSTQNTFVRGDAWMANEGWRTGVAINVGDEGRQARAIVSQTNDAALRIAVNEAEALLSDQPRGGSPLQLLPKYEPIVGPKVRFESTIDAMSVDRRSDTARGILQAVERHGVIAAGNTRQRLYSMAAMNTIGYESYQSTSYGEVNVNARTADGKGSGWGWSGYEDWARVDAAAAAGRAADLAVRSADPVAVEPGRYTVILEPGVVSAMLWPLVDWASNADQGGTPFSTKPVGSNKMGLKMLSERLSLKTDLWDPEMPQTTVSLLLGYAKANVLWYERGVLMNLIMGEAYARARNRQRAPKPEGFTLFGHGPTQTLDEMIKSTKRGIWVNRIGSIAPMNDETALRTGTTRDGTFLIENGKITKAIKNLRFTESIFFILNRVEAIGEPVRSNESMVAPRLKVRDFDFTSLTDAI